jgi:hypothetical protein
MLLNKLKLLIFCIALLISGCYQKEFDCSKVSSQIMNQLFIDCMNTLYYSLETSSMKTSQCENSVKELMCEQVRPSRDGRSALPPIQEDK